MLEFDFQNNTPYTEFSCQDKTATFLSFHEIK